MSIEFGTEVFPPPQSYEFEPLFNEHANEVRGRRFCLDYRRYEELERTGRLVWIVGRDNYGHEPVGYACGWRYRDMHFDERVAADDLWFVIPVMRGRGIGRMLKVNLHQELKKRGAVRVYETVRSAYNHPQLMTDLGYLPWGNRWVKTL